MNYFLCGLRFGVATLTGTLIALAFVLAELQVGRHWAQMLQSVMFVLASNLAGIVGSYISERQARATWRAEQRRMHWPTTMG